MPKPVRLNAIAREIKKVQRALERVRGQAALAERKIINLRLKKLKKLHSQTQLLCTKAFVVWPIRK